ncbi:MAG: hypothetical protein J6S04_06185, partial [Clostridia bacterium]|nr:hypothetical protein [Clostridia bacterium]
MSKIKAKLTALLMAAACCLACIGIGVSMNKSDQVVASAATVEELTAEFTNNGQFTVGQFRDDMPFEIVDSTTEGVPEGASGAVLKITGVGDDTTSSGGAFATLDFTAAGLYRSGVDVIVRVYQPSNFSFRVSKKANNADWTTQATPAAGWQEVTLSGAANATEDHQIMTTMSMGLRRGTECYIDSITVVDNAAKQEFTNNGQFDVKQYSTNRAYYVDGSAEGLPEGYTGTVLKLDVGSTQYVTFDFTGANLLETDVLSMTAKCYLPNAYTNSAGTATYTDSSYQVRLGNIENSAGGYGEYNMSTWFDANINVNHAQFAKDENGYLTTVIFGLRNKGNTASYFYIDGITVNMVEYDIVQVGAVESYATTANATRVDRLYLKPTDQTVAWYGANENFTYVSGTGLQVIRNGEVVATLKPTLANRNTAAGKDSNVKHFYLTISSLTLQAGDIVKYGGIYQNSTVGMRYVIEDSEILWDGISWGKNEAYSEPSAITKLKPVTPSITATGASNKAVYLKMKSGEALPFQSWENAWVYESGTGLKVNGESVTMKSMQSAPEGIYITFDELTAGDVVTFGGTFRCPAQKIKYTIEDSNFVWNGSIWEPEYTVYNVGDVNFRIVGGTGNRYVYLHPINKTGFDTTTWNSGWDAKFSWKDGTGITLNGETVSGASIKFPGDFFIDLGAAPQVGDILRVGGTYYNVSLAKEYIINEAAFIYDGTKWDKYVEYTTHELTGLTLYGNSATTDKANAGKLHLKASGFAHPAEAMIFTLESGIGLAVNDQQITWTTFKNSVDKYLYLTFNALNVGDKLTIGGTFVCEEKAVKYIIEETNFWWNGTSWQTEEYVINYTAHELGVLAVHPHSDGTTGNVPNATQLYMKVAVGTAPAIPADGNNGWDTSFELTSGDGWKVNGTSVTVGALLNTNSGFYVNLANAGIKAGDILTVSGTFSNATVATKYVIEESTFIWAGTAWLNYVEPTTYNIGKLAIDGGSSTTA